MEKVKAMSGSRVVHPLSCMIHVNDTSGLLHPDADYLAIWEAEFNLASIGEKALCKGGLLRAISVVIRCTRQIFDLSYGEVVTASLWVNGQKVRISNLPNLDPTSIQSVTLKLITVSSVVIGNKVYWQVEDHVLDRMVTHELDRKLERDDSGRSDNPTLSVAAMPKSKQGSLELADAVV